MAKSKDAPETVIELSITIPFSPSLNETYYVSVVIGLFEDPLDALSLYRLIKSNNPYSRIKISFTEIPNPRITKSGCILLDSDRVF